MISDRDIWAAAQLMLKRYKADAMIEAAARADQLSWRLAGRGYVASHPCCIERIQAQKPAEGEGVH